MRDQTLAKKIIDEALQAGTADANGVMLQLQPGSDVLVVSCSGIVPERVVYAMENSTAAIATNKLFICDRASSWYYGGIAGLTTDFPSTVTLVSDIVDMLTPKRVCTVGTSGGGYMALALGCLLGVDRVLALSPQTSLSHGWRAEIGETRWASNMARISELAGANGPLDILSLLQASKADTACHVVYSGGDALDRVHAARLSGLPHVYVHQFSTDNHNVSAALSQAGRLRELLTRFISTDLNLLPQALSRLMQ